MGRSPNRRRVCARKKRSVYFLWATAELLELRSLLKVSLKPFQRCPKGTSVGRQRFPKADRFVAVVPPAKYLRNCEEINFQFMLRIICSEQGKFSQEYWRISRKFNAVQGKLDKQK